MKLRRLFSCMMALLLICSLPLAAFADIWYLEDGDITVSASADESGTTTQTVTQGETSEVDPNPTITCTGPKVNTNTITILAEEGAEANVTIEHVDIKLSGSAVDSYSGVAVITITAEENATANVTLSDVHIDVSKTTAISAASSGEAAVQIMGDGDVTIELDGLNTVKSGDYRAGVEKNDADSSGSLTITDENGTSGSLEAIGGYKGAGIGGDGIGDGMEAGSDGSNITIAGSAEVNATGGYYGAGIGGGSGGSGSDITITDSAEVTAKGGSNASGIGGGSSGSGSDITISGSAEVNATGGDGGSGIGGGNQGDGVNITISGSAEVNATGGNSGAGIGGGSGGSGSDITISGSAEVTAKGGIAGAGIGGGNEGSGSNITVSGDAQVKAQGGDEYYSLQGDYSFGAGAAIGDGGSATWGNHPEDVKGKDAEVTTDAPEEGDSYGLYVGELDEGWVATYAPGKNMDTDIPDSLTYKDDGGEVQTEDDSNDTIPDPGSKLVREDAAQPLYRVIGQDGKAISYKAEQSSGVLTITVDADFAALTGFLSGMKTLKAQGIDTIVFVTNGASSSFALSDLLAQGFSDDTYDLTHDGSTVTFTLGQADDISNILK